MSVLLITRSPKNLQMIIQSRTHPIKHSQKSKKYSPVVIYEENILTVIALLSNMMNTTFDYNS